ncbi:MAG: GNAT family N-acetyltransferase [Pseudomonadota bacterium]
MISEAKAEDAAMLADMSCRLMQVQGLTVPDPEVAEQGFVHMLSNYYRAAIVSRDGRPAGYALWRDEPGHTYLRHFFIEDWARGGGLGARFFEALARDWFPAGTPVFLDVMDRNGPGHAFWGRLGFTRASSGYEWISEKAHEARPHRTEGIEVVEATPADMGELVRLYRQLCTVHGVELRLDEADRRLTTILSAPYRANLFREEHSVVGSALWMDMGDHVFLRQFTVDEQRLRSGVGTRAFRALKAACFPGRDVELSATNLMKGSEKFWKSQGFEALGTAFRSAAEEAA